MIKEIVQFTEALPPDTFSRNLQLKEGLYIFLDVQEENGEIILKNVDKKGKLKKEDFGIFTKSTEMNPFFENCKERVSFIDPVSSNKAWNRKFFGVACNPYSLCFKKELYLKEDRHNEEDFKKSINEYFKNSKQYQNPETKTLAHDFQMYLQSCLWDFLLGFDEFKDLGKKTVFIFLKNVDILTFEKPYKNYLTKNVFNKDDYNEKLNEKVFGISDNLNGFNDKKRFLKHQTSALKYNYRIRGEDAQCIWKFFKLVQVKQLPNPCPIFVDIKEDKLNRALVSFHQDGKVDSYSGMIKKLIKEYDKEELQNFYLIFFQGTKGSRIADIDFVPLFRYELTDAVLFEPFPLGGRIESNNINNIFQLQEAVLNKIFNGQLIKKEGAWIRYFDDIEPAPKYHFTDAICNLMMQYRKAIYDYVYKAKYESITCRMFDEMMKTSILEDIRIDEFKNEQHSRSYQIKEKLNIWFSLYNYFSQNKNRENMVNKTVELQDELKSIIENENLHIETDSQFAFASGQLIWKILIQSKSANRSHALLEPFLQKTNVEQYKFAIAKTFDMYKHEFTLYPKKYGFDKLMGDMMGFVPDEKNMKNMLTYILAGYFSESII